MATTIQKGVVKNRKDTYAGFNTDKPVLYDGEIAYEYDTNKIKVGDGSSTYDLLPYVLADDSGSGDGSIIGFTNIDFTEMDTTSKPEIKAGSKIDIDDTLYEFELQSVILQSGISNGIVFVKIIPGATPTATFTNESLPEYDYFKRGFYNSSGERFVLRVLLNGTSYSEKLYVEKYMFDRNVLIDSDLEVTGTVDGIDLQVLQSEVDTNTAKVGITTAQATAITDNTIHIADNIDDINDNLALINLHNTRISDNQSAIVVNGNILTENIDQSVKSIASPTFVSTASTTFVEDGVSLVDKYALIGSGGSGGTTLGYTNLSFTEMGTYNQDKPLIEAGSSVEVNGITYTFDVLTTPTGTHVDGVGHVKIIGDGTNATAEFTNETLPDYNYLKKGYYNISGERFVLSYRLVNSGVYFQDKIFIPDNYFNYNAKITGTLEVGDYIQSDSVYTDYIHSEYISCDTIDSDVIEEDGVSLVDKYALIGSGGILPADATFDSVDSIEIFEDGVSLANKYEAIGGGSGASPITEILINGQCSKWNVTTSTLISGASSAAYSESLGLFVIAGRSTAINDILYSSNGVDWTGVNIGVNGYSTITRSDGLGLFVAGPTYNATPAYSTDGINWTTAAAPTISSSVMVSSDSLIVTFNASSGSFYSTDGENWTAIPAITQFGPKGACYSESLGLFVVVGYGYATESPNFYYSADGISWTGICFSILEDFVDIAFSESLGLFVVITRGSKVATSVDGINWTLVTASGISGMEKIMFAEGLERFVTSRYSGSGLPSESIAYSSDGINWTGVTTTAKYIDSKVVFSNKLCRFVGAGGDNIIYT